MQAYAQAERQSWGVDHGHLGDNHYVCLFLFVNMFLYMFVFFVYIYILHKVWLRYRVACPREPSP